MDRGHWESVFRDRTWEDVFSATGFGCKKDRGGKYVTECPCYRCGCEETTVGRPNGTFVCRECGHTGDKVAYVLEHGDLWLDAPEIDDSDYDDWSEEGILRRISKNLPHLEDPRQRRLFPHKKLRLHWIGQKPLHV